MTDLTPIENPAGVTARTSRRQRRHAFLAGARDILPIVPGVLPFAMIYGASAVEIGMPPAIAMLMSLVLFAGAAQLAAVQLISSGAAVPVVVLTALVINLRFVMYSASLGPHLRHLRRRSRALLAYLLTDQAYAVSIFRFTSGRKAARGAYYLGAGLQLWITWQTGTAAGVFLGSKVPPSWGLDFAVPLSFLALAVASVRDSPTAVAALVGGSFAVLARSLPFNLGLVGAVALGIASGLGTEILQGRAASTSERNADG